MGRFFFFKQKRAYEIRLSLVGSERCIRERSDIDDGTVDRDNQRKANEEEYGCYMTDAQIERGDCDIPEEEPKEEEEPAMEMMTQLFTEEKEEKEELDKIVEQQVELNNLLKRIGFIETEKDGLFKVYF